MNTIGMRAIVVLGLALVCSFPARAQKEIKSLKYPPLHEFQIPQPTKVTLDNGINLYLLEDHTLPKVNFTVIIHRCGGYLDPPDKVGVAEMAGTVMRTGGTGQKTGEQVDEVLDGIGASIETNIDQVQAGAWATGLSPSAETILETLSEIVRDPVFEQDKIDEEKTRERTDISRRNDEPTQIAFREFPKILYGADSPYARQPEYATVDAVSRDDMVAFHRSYVKPENTQIAAWGDFKTDEMTALLKRYFGDWARGTEEVPPARGGLQTASLDQLRREDGCEPVDRRGRAHRRAHGGSRLPRHHRDERGPGRVVRQSPLPGHPDPHGPGLRHRRGVHLRIRPPGLVLFLRHDQILHHGQGGAGPGDGDQEHAERCAHARGDDPGQGRIPQLLRLPFR